MAKNVTPPEIIDLSSDSDSDAESVNLLDGIDPVLLHAMLQPPPLRSNLRVAEKVDEGIMPSQKKLKRKSEGDGRPDENEKLTRTDAPMPGTSSSSVTTDVSHPTYGQLSYNKLEHDNRVFLLDWLREVSLNSQKHTDSELRPQLLQKMKDANIRQNDVDKKLVIHYTSKPLNNQKNGVKGYYVAHLNNNQRLFSYIHLRMRKTDSKEQYDAKRKDPSSETCKKLKLNRIAIIAKFPELEIIYNVGLFPPNLLENQSTADAIVSLEQFQPSLDRYKDEYEKHPGIGNGSQMGYDCMRPAHMKEQGSKKFSRTKGAPEGEKKCCVQIMTRMCDSQYTRKVAEAFWIRFGVEFDKEYKIKRHIYSEPEVPLPWNLF